MDLESVVFGSVVVDIASEKCPTETGQPYTSLPYTPTLICKAPPPDPSLVFFPIRCSVRATCLIFRISKLGSPKIHVLNHVVMIRQGVP